MKGKKVISRLTKVFYALGIVMLLSGMMLSAITSPALAQEQATQAASEGEDETSSDPTATPVPDEGSPDPTEEPDDEDGSGEPMELQVSGPALAVVAGPALSSVCKDDGSVEWWVTGTQGGVTYTLTSDLFSGAISLRNKNTVLVYTGPASSAYSVSITWTLPGGETGELYDEATVDMCDDGDEDPEWSKSSLSFEGSCVGDCEEVTAEVCNVGDGDMSGSVEYNVYFAASGNPKDGTIVDSGTVGPLAHGECADLTYTPTEDGNYMFQAIQEAGHPGTGELWSSECSIDQCSVPQDDDFTWTLESDPDSPSCQIEAGQMCTTFVVELHNIPVGYSVILQTTFHQVWPDNGDDKVYSATTLGEGVNEVEVCGLWPGIGDGNHMVEIHFGGKLFLADPSGNRQDLSSGNYDAEGVDIWYHPSMKEECEIPEEPVLEITETCPDFVNMQNNFTVSNTGSVDADFTWSSTNGESGSGSVLVGGTATITTTRGATPDTVTITFGSYGEKSATAMTDEEAELAECTLPEKPSLTIIATCPDFDNSLNAWLITNTGNVAVDFTWSSSEGESGSGSVGIGGTVSFTTPRGVTVETVTVSYGDGKTASGDSMTDEEAEEAECEVPQVPVLGLTSTCPDYLEDLNNWTITNIGPVATSYSWTSTTGESGSGTLGVSESVNFSTDRSFGPDEVTVTYGTDKSVKETAMTDEEAEAELCEMPPELIWDVQGEGDYAYCEWDSLTTCTTFIVNLSNLGEDESAFLRTTFEEVLPDASSPVVTTTDLGNGETEVTVCGTWPGIAYGDHNVEIRFTAELVVVRGGEEEVLSETPESVTVWYDSETMKDQCEVPELQPVLLLDPYCVDVDGEWGMAWIVENPNAIDIEYTWDFPEISGATGSDIVLANDPGMLFYVSPLGTHKADVTWGDGQIASLEYTITTCEETPPTDDPTPVPTPPVNPPEFIPVTAVEQVEPPPVVDAGLLIPVTGAETSASQNGGFFQKLLYNIGFAFLGIGLIFSGLQRKFDK